MNLQKTMSRGISEPAERIAANKLSQNVEKTKQMIFSYKEHRFQNVECIKYLDVRLNHKLIWEPYKEIKYKEIVRKIKYVIYLIRSL